MKKCKCLHYNGCKQGHCHHFESGEKKKNAHFYLMCVPSPTCSILVVVVNDLGNRISTQVYDPNCYCVVSLYLTSSKIRGYIVPHTLPTIWCFQTIMTKARFPLPELKARVNGPSWHGPSTRLVVTRQLWPSTRAVNSGSGNRALVIIAN